VPFVPQYRRDWLDGIGAPDPDRRPFRVLFAGRVEPEKGVFDLIAIAKQFRAEGRTDVAFDVCGDGSALDELRARARHEKLEDVVGCHGHCNRDVMRQMLSQSHAVIVPTTTVIGEGMNKVVVEGVLAGRPVVTSSVCPAVEYVDGAAVQVPPEDVAAYADAIRRLCDDRAAYDEHRRQCRLTAEQFYDARLGWGAGLRRILSELARDDKRRPVEAPPSVVRGRSEPVETP
jgi:glycosyltransferase involved in cell wall biosynthesis